jgi:Txe/YoeB family toxin of Txe-Axe toxin-antitoxin module
VILAWTPEGWDDYLSLRAIEPEAVKKVNLLLKEISLNH